MQNAELYEKVNCLQRRDASISLQKYAPKIISKKNNIRIIDIGCGDGSVTSMLKKYLPSNYKLLGIDISENMVKFANEHHSNDHTSFTVMDFAGDLPENMKGCFDLVFSCYALHWFQNQDQVFRNIFNLLDKDGECVLIFVGCNKIHEVYRKLSQIKKWSSYLKNAEKYITPYQDIEEPDKEITKLMEYIGFDEIDVECKDTDFSYEDMDTMIKHLSAINPFEIPKDKYDEFMEDYIRLLSETDEINCSYSVNDIKFYYKLLTVYGRKP